MRNKSHFVQSMECSSKSTTTVTLVTLSATYVCTIQFNVISRHAHTGIEQNRDTGHEKRWEVSLAKMEDGPYKPDQLVM